MDEIERIERASAPRDKLNALTVRRFFDETWLPLRQQVRQWAWKNDKSAMETHFLPVFGGRSIWDLASDGGQVELLNWTSPPTAVRSSY